MEKIIVRLLFCCPLLLIFGCVSTRIQPDTEVWYTTNNGLIIVPNVAIDSNPILSNTIIDGKGVLVFKEPLSVLPDSIFANANSLIRMELPSSIRVIGNSAFYQCSHLQSIVFPEIIGSIGADAFWGCESMKEITLPSQLKTICPKAFMNCSRLESINFPRGLESISDNAFNGCHSLSGIISIPDNVVYIGAGCFDDCKMIDGFNGKFVSADGRCLVFNHNLIAFSDKDVYSYTIPEDVYCINESVFSHSNIYEIKLPDSIHIIGDYAFYHCVNLRSINIPESIDSIGSNVFTFCEELDSILVEGPHTHIKSLKDHNYYEGPIVNYCFPENYIVPPSEFEWIIGTWHFDSFGQDKITFIFEGTGEEGDCHQIIDGAQYDGAYQISKEDEIIRLFFSEKTSYDVIEIHSGNRLYGGSGIYYEKQ